MKLQKSLWICLRLFLMIAASPPATAQTTIYSTNFGATANVNPPGWTFTGLNMNISTHSPRSTGYAGASGQCYLAEGNSADFTNTSGTPLTNSQPGISTAALLVSTVGHADVTISFAMRKSAGYNSDVVYSLEWSTDGISYTPITFTEPTAGTWGLASGSGLNLPAGAGNQPTLYLRWSFNRTGPNYGLNFRMDDFSITGTGIPCTPPSISSVSSNSPVCTGGTVNLSLSASGSAILSYSWSGPNGFSSTTEDPSISNATTVATGIYTVNVTNSCGSVSATTSATVNPLPTVGANATATTVCAGTSVTLTGTGAVSYSWSGGVSDGVPFTPSSTATHTVTGTDANGCSATASATITVNPLPTVGANATATTVCAGTSVTLTGTGALSYSWSGGISDGVPFTPSSTATYTVTGTDGNGCTATASVTITVNPLPAASITSGGSTTFCQGGSVTLISSSATSYLWSTSEMTSSINVTASGNYTVQVTDANGCSAISTMTEVTVNPLPAANITPGGSTTFCQGGSVTLISSSATSYLWSTSEMTSSINVTASGNYTVQVTDANGCSATSSATQITVNPLPTAIITPGGSTTLCPGDSVTLTADAATSYLWSTSAATQSITVNTTGNYSVIVTDANGCTASSSAVAVTVTSLPTAIITASGNTVFCQGDSISLTANAGASYLWSNNETSQSIYITQAGNYSVTVTYAGGCTGTAAAVQTTVNPLPAIPVITPGSSSTFCQGDSVTLTSSSAVGYLWITGETSQSITVDTSGNYFVIISDGNSCTASSLPIAITVNPLPSTAITADGPTSFCPGGSVTLTVSAAESYLWSTGATTQSILADTTGNYTVTVTDINGCTNNNSLSPAIVTIVTDPTDINRDGITNNVDFLLLLSQFNVNCTLCAEDINQDGMVNNVDFLLLLGRFNMTCQ